MKFSCGIFITRSDLKISSFSLHSYHQHSALILILHLIRTRDFSFYNLAMTIATRSFSHTTDCTRVLERRRRATALKSHENMNERTLEFICRLSRVQQSTLPFVKCSLLRWRFIHPSLWDYKRFCLLIPSSQRFNS